jgi:cyclophilin family peptidyl-prolyl cis-trans isomerase
MNPRLPRVAPLLAACTLLAACGSSAGSTSSPGSGAAVSCTTTQFTSPLQPKDAPADKHAYASAPAMQIDSSKLYKATISTQRGDIVLCLQPGIAPNTVNNFVVLARNKFYDGLTFHRVVPGFVIQGGDPQGNGAGGPGYQFADEPVHGDYTPGCVAMANAGPGTNGSQFFICIADDTKLPKQYSLFGKVIQGLDVAQKIQQGDVMTSVTVQESQ